MDKQVSRQFFNDKATDWDETPRSNAAYQLEAMAARLGLRDGERVLDVGTGTGVFVPYIKQMIGFSGHIACVDFALEMLLIAKNKNTEIGIMPVCAEIETVGFKPGIFDAVVCYSTFPHFHDKSRALRNIHFLLKDAGKIFICHTASREQINRIHLSIPDFQDHLIPECTEMISLLKYAGFTQVSVDERNDSYLAQGSKLN